MLADYRPNQKQSPAGSSRSSGVGVERRTRVLSSCRARLARYSPGALLSLPRRRACPVETLADIIGMRQGLRPHLHDVATRLTSPIRAAQTVRNGRALALPGRARRFANPESVGSCQGRGKASRARPFWSRSGAHPLQVRGNSMHPDPSRRPTRRSRRGALACRHRVPLG